MKSNKSVTNETIIFDYPFKKGVMGTLPETIAWAQKHKPVCPVRLPSGTQVWMVSRKDDIHKVMTDARFSRNLVYPGAPRFVGEDFTAVPGGIFNLDPPDHTRVRHAIQHFYSKEKVEDYRPIIERNAKNLLEKMSEGANPTDLLQAYVNPLPLQVSCEIFKIPIDHRERYLSYFKAQTSLNVIPEEVASATAAISAFSADIIENKRSGSERDDPIGALIQAQETGTINEEELQGTTSYLLVTGSEPLVAALGTGCVTLMSEHDALQECISDPALWPKAVEELLRYHHNGVLGLPRVVKEDVEMHGVLIRKGDAVCSTPLGATWDPHHYPNPSKFNIHRETDATPTFGFGPHFCLGAFLTRMFLKIAYAALFKHFPSLQLAIAAQDVPWEENMIFTKPAFVPVTW